MLRSLVGSEMCIRDRTYTSQTGRSSTTGRFRWDRKTFRRPSEDLPRQLRLAGGATITIISVGEGDAISGDGRTACARRLGTGTTPPPSGPRPRPPIGAPPPSWA
eukprot:TRINITY_DN9439_c0_g1_i2.p1 TRINITY_DN9439_c0_g1~~TRINITY_DN9439_c0_g1_i2.p1  ORF type:complete len:105 (+),score=2.15 TRINITY_DN9439_c0_g1_i2:116-430(+)